MGEGSSGLGSTLPPGAGDSETTPIVPSREPATQPWPRPAGLESPHEPTYVPPQAEAVPHEPVTYRAPRQPPPDAWPSPPDAAPPAPSSSEVLRYGPGVPASQAGAAAESVWRTGHRPEPPPRQRRLRRLRRLLGLALTVILLVAAGIVLYLRFFDHPALHVTGVHIKQQTKNGCTVDVTGRIDTNGSAGTVSYQWVFRPQTQAPQPLNQSVVAGQHAVYVTVAVEGQGHGSATQTVTLDVLGPGTGTDSTNVTVSC